MNWLNPEIATILCMTSIVLSAIWHMPPDSGEKVALALGGALGGYLTKTAVDIIKSAASKPDAPKPVENQQGQPMG